MLQLKPKWDWEELSELAPENRTEIEQLQSLLTIEEARELLTFLSDPILGERIVQLADLEAWQQLQGAGFYGMIPKQIKEEDVIVPHDANSAIKASLWLARVRRSNLEAIRSISSYVLQFENREFPDLKNVYSVPDSWSLEIDLTPVSSVLEFFDGETSKTSKEIAELPGYREMLKHRRGLGYIPEPLPTNDSLAKLIDKAASMDSLVQLWKWVNPNNLFDLADIYRNRKQYRRVVDSLDMNNAKLTTLILGQLARYAPDVVFQDRLTFAVEWGIRGWATSATGGVSLEQFKDRYDLLIDTMVHETFHRLQTKICRASFQRDSFEAILSYPFPSETDRKFYETLAIIMAEGTATHLGKSAVETEYEIDEEKVRRGIDILQQAHDAIYTSNDLEKAEELVVLGHKSTGPFYDFGAFATAQIESKFGPEGVKRGLVQGAPSFFVAYNEASPKHLALSDEVMSTLRRLLHQME